MAGPDDQAPASPASGPEPEPAAQRSERGRVRSRGSRTKWWQRIAWVCFSFLLLVGLELVLRLVSPGPDVHLARVRAELDGTRIIGIDPAARDRFFFRQFRTGLAGKDPVLADFRDPKPPGTFRVFFVGASSVQGWPHPPNASMCAFLQVLLSAVWPDRQVEVINCGVTAVNSYSLRAWVPELLDYEPDLVVVYAGHNEFYGPYGVGSLHGVGTSRTAALVHIWLNQQRTFQLLRRAVRAVRPPPPPPKGKLMELLAKERAIRLDSELYRAGLANFRANLEDIAAAVREAGVPLVLCGLVCNQRDLVPLASVHRDRLSPAEREQWQDHFENGTRRLAGYEPERALAAFQQAAKIDDSYAELVFRMAQCYEQLGRYDRARELFERARDLDALRFRASGQMNRIIRQVAEGTARYVDTEQAFRRASPQGLIGWNLMTDHVHPTARGHYLIARAICEALARPGGGPSLRREDLAAIPTFEAARRQLGHDVLDDLVLRLRLAVLFGHFPFEGTANASRRLFLLAEYRRDLGSLDALIRRGFESWKAGKPALAELVHLHVAKALLAGGEPARAIPHAEAAVRAAWPHSLQAVEARALLVRSHAAAEGKLTPENLARLDAAVAYARETLAVCPGRRARLEQLMEEMARLRRERRLTSAPTATGP